MLKHSTVLFCLYLILYSGIPLYAQDSFIISAMSNTGATKPVSEVLRLAYQQVGIEIEIKELPGLRGLYYADTGRSDGEAYRIEGLESNYTNLVKIDVPVRQENMYFYVIKGNEFNVQGWEAFPDAFVLGYIRGTYFVEQSAEKHSINLQPSSNYVNLLRQLDSGRNNVIIMSTKGAKLINELNLKNEIVKLQPPARSFSLYHYLHKRNSNLIPKITESLRKMQASGQIEQINSPKS